MTKNEEMEILREAARKLGTDSYCGPWLMEQMVYIEANIRADIKPVMTYAEVREKQQEMLAECNKTCTALKQEAVKSAKEISEQGRKAAEEWKNNALQSLRLAIRNIEDA